MNPGDLRSISTNAAVGTLLYFLIERGTINGVGMWWCVRYFDDSTRHSALGGSPQWASIAEAMLEAHTVPVSGCVKKP